MEFEWDEAKRLTNIAKHRIDFFDVQAIFDGRPVMTQPSSRDQELRFATTGVLEDKFITGIWTPREEFTRIISARRARYEEIRKYRELHG
jgi:uncharacterized protein